MLDQVCLSVKGLKKSYGGITVLQNSDIDFYQGEIHALCGENGAGKSTLCKMLSGAITPDEGVMHINGHDFTSFNPNSSKEQGIAMIYQEFNLYADLPVYENMYIGKELRKGIHVDKSLMIKKSREIFESLGVNISPTALIRNLSVAECQLVEIGKMIMEEKKVLIMDEPTAPLTTREIELLFKIVKKLKNDGICIIYISHRLEEVFELADRVSVLRDGQLVATKNIEDTNRDDLIKMMIGRELTEEFPPYKNTVSNEVALSAKNLNTKKIKDISFELYKGEILGIGGLVGAGRTEVLRAIFGADNLDSGEVFVGGNKKYVKSPGDAILAGIGLLPEDRKRQGIFLNQTIALNITIIKIKELCKLLTISKKNEKKMLDKYINAISIKLPSVTSEARSLSGGNQQKLAVAKWLSTEADVLFFDEPTRGIDVSAKRDIYDLMFKLKEDGKAIIMVSSDMPELLGLCDRIVVMHDGVITGELSREEATQESIMRLAIK